MVHLVTAGCATKFRGICVGAKGMQTCVLAARNAEGPVEDSQSSEAQCEEIHVMQTRLCVEEDAEDKL